jgi:hypothetical protein
MLICIQGKLVFKETDKVRTKMVKPRASKQPQPPPIVIPRPVVKSEPVETPTFPSIKISSNASTSMGPPKRPLAPERSQSASSEPPQKKTRIIKLKVPGPKMPEVQAILRSPPQPAIPARKSSSSTHSSPPPRPSPSPSITARSPSASTLSAIPAPGPGTPTGGIVVKPARKPLPDAAPSTGRKPLPDGPPPPLNRTPSLTFKLKIGKKKDPPPST